MIAALLIVLASIPSAWNALGTDPEAFRDIVLLPSDAETAAVVAPTNVLVGGASAAYAWASPRLTVRQVPTHGTIDVTVGATGYVTGNWSKSYAEFVANPKVSMAKVQATGTCIGQTKWVESGDLDAHMLVKSGGTTLVHIGYGQTAYKGTWTDSNGHGKITHKLDDLNGGAGSDGETLTIYETYAGYTYEYYIYRYGGVSSIYGSGAEAEVTFDNAKVATVKAAEAAGDTSGTWWHVFDVVNGHVTVVNTLSSSMQ